MSRVWTFERDDDAPVYSVRLEAGERAVLLDLVDDVVALLGGEEVPGSGETDPAAHPLDSVRLGATAVRSPSDPALLRLLPDASREDPAVAAEFRRLTEPDVRAGKVANLMRLRAALEGARPDALVLASEAPQLAAAMTDLRLVISERLGLRTDEDADALVRLAHGDPPVDERDQAGVARRFLATVYLVLSVLQESLVELMLQDLPDAAEPPRGQAT